MNPLKMIKTKKKFVLWGVGRIGEREIHRLCFWIDIAFAVDKSVGVDEEGAFYGYKVFNPEVVMSHRDDYYILVACESEEPIYILMEHGFRYFYDFLSYRNFDSNYLNIRFFDYVQSSEERKRILKHLACGRKICLMYGECHMTVYSKILSASKEFCSEYAVLDMGDFNLNIGNPQYSYIKKYMNQKETYELVDILIANKIVNPLNAMLKYLPESCKKIFVTDLRFEGYFIQRKSLERSKSSDDIDLTDFIWGNDIFVDKLLEDGISPNDIADIVSDEDYIDLKCVEDYFEQSLKKLENCEKKYDIKICDWLRKNAPRKLLYYNFQHPYLEVYLEISNRIFDLLGIKRISLLELSPCILEKSLEAPVYPSVMKALGEEFSNSVPKTYKYSMYDIHDICGGMTFKETIKYYCVLNEFLR